MIPVFDDSASFVIVAYGLTLLGWCVAALTILYRTRRAKNYLECELDREEEQEK